MQLPKLRHRLRRRQVALLAATGAFGVPLRLMAQRFPSVKLGIFNDSGRDKVSIAMINRLAVSGWIEGRNLRVEFGSAGNRMRPAALVKELVQLKCDVILAVGTPAALTVKASAPTTPLVFLIGGDPVKLGLVSSLSRPGGNATGFTSLSQELIAKQLALLRDLVPAARRIAVMFEASNQSSMQGAENLMAMARSVGTSVEPVPLETYKDVENAYRRWKHEPVDGLLVLSDSVTSRYAARIGGMTYQLRMPAVFGARQPRYVIAVVSYGVDFPALILRSADYVARVLGGAKVSELPVQQADRFELIVNLTLAAQQGLSVPQSVLLQATEVIR
jgi:putative ABC transport system substrate-binding protein